MERTHILIATDLIRQTVKEFQAAVTELRRGDVQTALKVWETTREDYEALDTLRKDLNRLLEEMSRVTLPDMFTEQNTKTISLADISKRFTVNQRINCSMTDKELGFKWLRENGHGGLITEVVNAQTLSAWAKRQVQDEGMDLPGDLFNITTMNYISATKIK